MTQLTTNFCKNCGTEYKEGMVFCGNCGNAINQQPSESFGYGKPLGFFNLLYNFGLGITIFTLLMSIIVWFTDFQKYYNSDISQYIAYNSNTFQLILIILDILLVLLSIYTRIKNNKVGFSKILIYRVLLLVITPFIGMLITYFEFGIDSINIQTIIGPVVIELIMSLFIYIYLTQLFDFKWFDFSGIFVK